MDREGGPLVHLVGGIGFDSNVLVLEGEHPVVIDAGTGTRSDHYIKRIREHLGDRGVDRIVLTHRHFDHSGGVAAFARELDAPVYIHEVGVETLRTGDGETSGGWLFGAKLEPVDAQPLKEGDVVDAGPARFKVLHTPGHSPDAVALWEPRSRTLVPGDTVYAHGGIGRWDLAGGDYDQLVATLERLAALEAESMFPGHGPTVSSGAVEHILMGLHAARMFGGG